MSNAYWPAEKYKPNECIIDAYAPANSTQRSKFAEWNKPCGKGGSDQGCGGSATTFSTNLPINTMPLTQSTRAPILTTPPTPSLTKPPTSTGKPIIPPIIGILGSLLYGVEQTTQPIGLVTENPLENMTESVQQTQPTSLMTENAPYTQSTEVVTNIPPTKEAPKNLKPCIQWYAKNTLMVEIYYERIDLMTNMELPAYTLLMLISDIGGQIGFW
uniref:Uncharacterized protein n=1 Tax=Acrobeloides nanus TaxID=290746 RepID=A0A914ED88_9BILA